MFTNLVLKEQKKIQLLEFVHIPMILFIVILQIIFHLRKKREEKCQKYDTYMEISLSLKLFFSVLLLWTICLKILQNLYLQQNTVYIPSNSKFAILPLHEILEILKSPLIFLGETPISKTIYYYGERRNNYFLKELDTLKKTIYINIANTKLYLKILTSFIFLCLQICS